VIQDNLTTAIILEDDVDWDIRLKSQLQKFSLGSRKFLQPLRRDKSKSLADFYPPPPGDHSTPAIGSHVVELNKAPRTMPPLMSPYGDNWDILWLGHIGTEFPIEWKSLEKNRGYLPRSMLTVVMGNDETVPAPKHLKRHPLADRTDKIASLFPPHVRLIHESRNTVGIQAYAVSQRGARRLLWQFGLETFTNGYDLMLRDWCDGAYETDWEQERPVCLTVQPPLISHYFPKGGSSDIGGVGGGYMRRVGSCFIRYSVKNNLGRIFSKGNRKTEQIDGLQDQWPDEGPGPW
jgi:hypothetical protein